LVDVTAPFSVALPSPLPITVNAGASVTLPLKFTPATIGVQTGKITLHESSGEMLLVVDVSGEGIQNQPPPMISSFSPAYVEFGDNVTVLGQYFSGVTDVKIGSASVYFDLISDTEILLYAEASTGHITVVTPFGTVTSSGYLRIIYPREEQP
jgi:hypothetical protein